MLIWKTFADMEEQALHDILTRPQTGGTGSIIYREKAEGGETSHRKLGQCARLPEDLVAKIGSRFGVENVKVVEKGY